MKTLTLLLILLAGQMFGQQDDCYNTHYDYEEAMKRRHKQEQVDSVWTIFIQSKVIELVLEYAEECYNDSTMHYNQRITIKNYLPLRMQVLNYSKESIDSVLALNKVYYIDTLIGQFENERIEYLIDKCGKDAIDIETINEYSDHKQPTFEGFIEFLRKKYMP